MSIKKVINQLDKHLEEMKQNKNELPRDIQELKDVLDAFINIERRLQHCENYVNAKKSKGECKCK